MEHEMNEARKYLNRARIVSALINEKEIEIVKLQAMIEGGAISFESDGSTKSSVDNGRNERMIIQLTMLKDELEEQQKNSLELKSEIMATIDKLENANYISVLYGRYIHFKSFYEISEDMNYSVDWVKTLHRNALNEVEEILKGEEVKTS